MVIRMSLDQIMGRDLDDRVYAEWFVDTIMPKAVPERYDVVRRDELIEMTLSGLIIPRHFAIRRRDLMAQVLVIMWALGPSFYLVPEFRAVLDRVDLSERDKVDALYEIEGDPAAEAMETLDTRHWFPWLIDDNIFGLTDDPQWDIEDSVGAS